MGADEPKKKGFAKFFVNNWFMITTIAGVIIGFGGGFALQNVGLSESSKMWLGTLPSFEHSLTSLMNFVIV